MQKLVDEPSTIDSSSTEDDIIKNGTAKPASTRRFRNNVILAVVLVALSGGVSIIWMMHRQQAVLKPRESPPESRLTQQAIGRARTQTGGGGIRFLSGETTINAEDLDGEQNTYGYFVQFKIPVEEESKERTRLKLEEHSALLGNYITDGAFLCRRCDEVVIEAVKQCSACGVAKIVAITSTTWKIEPDLWNLISSAESDIDKGMKVIVQVFRDDESSPTAQEILTGLSIDGIDNINEVSATRAIITTSCEECWHTIILDISFNEDVEWIEKYQPISPKNKFAIQTTQSKDASQSGTPITDRGIKGQGQIVGVGDTGIDMDACHFYDPDNILLDNQLNMDHTSVIYYHRPEEAAAGDGPSGHGTHVAGSIAGKAYTTSGGSDAFNGMAEEAKLVVFDMGSDEEFYGPNDIYSGYFPVFHSKGARITSSSWGEIETGGEYNTADQDVDEFVVANPDHVVVFAAGNDGSGVSTLSSPCNAKNHICVGATTAHEDSWEFLGYGQGPSIKVTIAETSASYSISTASFGPSAASSSVNSPAAAAAPLDGCSDYNNDVTGKAVIIRRGGCLFDVAGAKATDEGATLLIIINEDDTLISISSADTGASNLVVNIPVVMVPLTVGNLILQALSDGEAVTIQSPSPVGFPVVSSKVAKFSSRGPTADGRNKPDIVAPGHFIVSANSDGVSSGPNCQTSSTDGASPSVRISAGTSMATPVVSGNAALVRQYFLDGWYPSGAQNIDNALYPSASLVKAVILNSGHRLTGQYVTFRSDVVPIEGELPDFQQGFGQVALGKALHFEDSTHSLFVEDSSTISSSETINFCFNVAYSETQSFKATLVWTDPAASLTSATKLVNDLDLQAISVDGSRGWQGNRGEMESVDSASQESDHLNNVEQVEISDPLAVGFVWVSIVAVNVPIGPQSFSLVVTGSFEQLPSTNCSTGSFGLCPNSCSSNGGCQINGLCLCDSEHTGADCSISGLALGWPADIDQPVQSVAEITQNGVLHFKVNVPSTTLKADLRVIIEPVDVIADLDIYIAFNRFPTSSSFDLANTTVSNGTTSLYLEENDIENGVMRIAVHSYYTGGTAGAAGISFRISLETDLPHLSEIDGSLASTSHNADWTMLFVLIAFCIYLH